VATTRIVTPDAPVDGPEPIGRPLPGGPAYVIDHHGRLAAPEFVGELMIGGAGLAHGYWHRPAATAERFVPSPFGDGERLYRTGDLVRRRRDGDLVFVGRADQQIKVRGMRIEPAEIQTVLAAHPAVTAALIVATGPQAAATLIGYAVAVPDRAADPGLASELVGHLRERLPGPMVPHQVIVLNRWPMTVGGKVDRDRLPPPAPSAPAGPPPVGPVETAIARAYAAALHTEPIGRTGDFFLLGGHSLLAVHVARDLAERDGLAVTAVDVLSHPTPAGLAEELARRDAGPAASGDELAGAIDAAMVAYVADLPDALLDEDRP
jgi:hypothetical protein